MSERDDPSLKALREAVAALPQNLPLRRQLCEELERAGHVEEALETARPAQAPDARLLLCTARCFYELGRYQEALSDYDKAVALDVSVADAQLRDKISRTAANPRARLRLVADPEAAPAAA